jgi:outer membrane protein assembly factor BamB
MFLIRVCLPGLPAILVSLCGVLIAGETTVTWPSFRGTGARGVATGQYLPDRWEIDTGDGVRWTTPIPGLANSAPVIWNDRVFVTTAVSDAENPGLRIGQYGAGDAAEDDSQQSWRVLCLNSADGRVLWERTASEGLPPVRRHTKSSHANSTPATDGRHVVALFNSGGLYCFDVCGNLCWSRELGLLDSGAFDVPELQWGFGSSSVIFRNLVIVQCDIQKGSFIAAFALDTGEEVWRADRDELPSWGTPTVYEGASGPQVIANGSRFVRGYDALTGQERWRLGGNSFITVPTPFVANGLIFVTSGYRPVQPIYAINPEATGDITLRDGAVANEHIAWSNPRGGTYIPTPIVVGQQLYMLSGNGVLDCYDATTGELHYRRRVGLGESYSASPVAADGKLYLTAESGLVSVIKTGDSFELLAENELGDYCLATPAIANRQILFRTASSIVAIGNVAPGD